MTTSVLLSDNGVSSGSAGIKTQGGNDGTLQLQTTTSGGTATTAVTIDTSQNVGVGTTPSAWGSTSKVVQLSAGSIESRGNTITTAQNAYFNGTNWIYSSTAAAGLYAQTAGTHYWYNAISGSAGSTVSFTQAMTLDSSGNLLVNQTSQAGAAGKIAITFAGGSQYGIKIQSSVSNTGTMAQFLNSAGTEVGTISTTNTTTSYVTSSDYRLKENPLPMQNALATVAQLKPCTYTWKSNGSEGQGFIAHELQEVVPDCVVGEKDAVDADGNPVYQGIDTSFLVATLTAAIQEQQALITQLQADVAQLKGAQA